MASAAAPPPAGGLKVIALVSGGKDSFFSLLHCMANGHRVVALANLHPARPSSAPSSSATGGGGDAAAAAAGVIGDAGGAPGPARQQVVVAEDDGAAAETADLNSFMYQTVGHEVIPLYAAATGLPLYRRAISGGAVQSGRDYSHAAAAAAAAAAAGDDETESMLPLLREVMAAHPEANALCAGAILSNYQRTRVESVALRLGLTPLAYLWKFPLLPAPAAAATADGGGEDGAQLLRDMAAAGLEARIIKVASGGLDESALWEDVASPAGAARVARAMRRFGGAGAGGGAVLGEGGEFETLVVDGPRRLFGRRVAVADEDRVVVREGGGAAWLRIRGARLEEKPPAAEGEGDGPVRRPDMLEARFRAVLEAVERPGTTTAEEGEEEDNESEPLSDLPGYEVGGAASGDNLLHWSVAADAPHQLSIEEETASLVREIRARLQGLALAPTAVISTVITLRRMADFPAVNGVYGALFPDPNPPARVTISCGDRLPRGANIAISLAVHRGPLGPGDRDGLHVQSRSYWAPANIGPYSQAVAVPLSSLVAGGRGGSEGGAASSSSTSSSSSPRLVYIAGQIPLIPASMELPAGPGSFPLQLALSLQHLWRVGAEMGVQWWAGATAYLPRAPSPAEARRRAILAARAWRAAHAFGAGAGDDDDGDDDEEESGGPDLWDRRYNPQYMSLAGGGAGTGGGAGPPLPDWEVVAGAAGRAPYVFAAEVEELPRGAAVEWHAHAGLGRAAGPGGVRAGGATVTTISGTAGLRTWDVGRCVLEAGAGAAGPACAHSCVALRAGPAADAAGPADAVRGMGDVLRAGPGGAAAAAGPYLLYVDAAAFPPEDVAGAAAPGPCSVIPCASLWDGRGRRLRAVGLFRDVRG